MPGPPLDRLARRVVLTQALVAALLITVSVGVFISARTLEQRATDVRETLLDLQRLRGDVLSAETGLRGFALTRNEDFLEPYRTGIVRVPARAARVVRRIHGADRAAAARIGPRFETWRADFAEPVLGLLGAQQLDRAQALIETGRGKVHTDAIRQQVRDLDARERDRLADAQDRADTLQVIGLVAVVLLGLVAVLAALRLLGRLRRDVVRPVEALAHASEAFGAGDHDVRAPVGGVHEARVASESFNAMAAQMGRTVEELRELDELKSRFVSTVSHELRTPLTSIRGFAEELVDEADALTADQLEAVDVILRNAGHLEDIIDDLLLLSSLEAGRVVLQREPVAIPELVIELCREFGPAARSRGVTIVPARGGEEVATVSADRKRLRQAIANLVSNAVKFSPQDGAVEIEVRGDDGTVVVEVRDRGPGIPAAELEHIGERFYRASTAAGTSGTGLGLTITRELVQRHDGRLEIDTTVGAGSTFRLVLPVSGAPGAGDQPRAAT